MHCDRIVLSLPSLRETLPFSLPPEAAAVAESRSLCGRQLSLAWPLALLLRCPAARLRSMPEYSHHGLAVVPSGRNSRSSSPPNGGVMALLSLPQVCLAGASGIKSLADTTLHRDTATTGEGGLPTTPKSGDTTTTIKRQAALLKSPSLFDIEEADDSEIVTLDFASPSTVGSSVTVHATAPRTTAALSWLSGGPNVTAIDSATRRSVSCASAKSADFHRRGLQPSTGTSLVRTPVSTLPVAKQLTFESANVSSRSNQGVATDPSTPRSVRSTGTTEPCEAVANYSWAGAATTW